MTKLLAPFFLLFYTFSIFALETPTFTDWVVDPSHYLSSYEKQQLSQTIHQLNQGTDIQAALLILPTLEGEDIATFSMRVVESWKLGKKGSDRGVLVLIVVKDARARIEVGYGLEGDLPDARCKQILAAARADFKSQNYFQGAQTILARIEKEVIKSGGVPQDGANALKSGKDGRHHGPRGLVVNLLFLIFVVILILKNLLWDSPFRGGYRSGRGGSGPGGGFPLGGGDPFGGGGGGGGGFGGGDGGSFGGGGSSDSW